MSRILRASVVVMATVLLTAATTGCWDRVEMNDLAIVIASAWDSAPNHQVRLGVQIAVPSQMSMGSGSSGGGGGGGAKPYMNASAVGRDIGDANQKVQLMISRRMFVAHRRIILLGEGLARHGIVQVLDEPTRNPQSRLRTDVVVTRGDAANYLKLSFPFEHVPTEGMRKMLYGTASDLRMDLKTLTTMIATPGYQAFIPIVKMKPPIPGERPKFSGDGVAIFKNGKMIGEMTEHELRGILWLTQKMRRGTVTVSIPRHTGHISFQLLRVRSEFKVGKHNGHPDVVFRLRPETDVIENDTDLDLSDPNNVLIAERAYSAEVRRRIEETLRILQGRFGADVVGFSEHVHQAEPGDWKIWKTRWDEEFARMPITVAVEGKVRRVGATGPSLTRRDDEMDS